MELPPGRFFPARTSSLRLRSTGSMKRIRNGKQRFPIRSNSWGRQADSRQSLTAGSSRYRIAPDLHRALQNSRVRLRVEDVHLPRTQSGSRPLALTGWPADERTRQAWYEGQHYRHHRQERHRCVAHYQRQRPGNGESMKSDPRRRQSIVVNNMSGRGR
jgi:hypothetical protein